MNNKHELKPWTQDYEDNYQRYKKEHEAYMQAIPGEEPMPEPDEDRMYKAMDNFVDIKGMAREFLKVQPLYYDENNIWWMWNWNKKKWEMIDHTDIMIRLDKASEEKMGTINPTQKSMILESLRREARKEKPRDAPKHWIQFQDSVIDLNEDRIIRRQPSPEYFITNTIPWRIGQTTATPNMDRIFEEWVGEDYVETLYEILAYCMLPDYPLNRIFALNGSGMNGKSKFLELLTTFIGDENVVSTDLDLIMKSRFEVAKLHKKLACLMGETNWNEMRKTAQLKRLCGGDKVRFEFKNKHPFDGYNYAKIIIATNSLPMTQDKTDGFYRRWMIVDFPNTFTEKKDILAEIPRVEYENLARKCINKLKKLLDRRSFHNEGSVAERRRRYEDTSNPLQRFIRERCVEDRNGFVFKWRFIERFNDWQKEHGYREWSKTQIGKEMNKDFDTRKERADDGSDNYWRAWIGLSWKEESESDGSRGFSGVSGVSGVVYLDVLYKRLNLTSAETAETAEVLEEKGVFTTSELYEALPVEVGDFEESVIDGWLHDMKRDGELMEVKPDHYKVLK